MYSKLSSNFPCLMSIFILFIDASIPQSPQRVKQKERVSDVAWFGLIWTGVVLLCYRGFWVSSLAH